MSSMTRTMRRAIMRNPILSQHQGLKWKGKVRTEESLQNMKREAAKQRRQARAK